MRTRRKLYPPPPEENARKRNRPGAREEATDPFDGLPEEILLLILSKLSFSAACPSDLISALLTCRRWRALVLDPAVLSRASRGAVAVRASRWSDSARDFLKLCVAAGNLEACYLLGMIEFYRLEERRSGIALLSRAAIGAHPAALYSLAVIHFNGSGGSKKDKDLRAGAALCARAAALGHVPALRELGHCLQDGYGVRPDPAAGRRCLLRAGAMELLRGRRGCTAAIGESWCGAPAEQREGQGQVRCFGGCGRVETRRHEFRRCSVCGKAKYCSRACQALDWRTAHSLHCGDPTARIIHMELA